jgi:hypothetical protein
MRRVKHLVKRFQFNEDERKRITLGPGTRLNPETGKIQLKAVGDVYPTGADLFVKTWITNPQALKRWTGFFSEHKHAKDSLGQPITIVRFRVGDGAQELYWNGSAWAVATSSNWNTEQEVADNIATFPVPVTKSIQIIINLRTQDEDFTPLVDNVRLLYESDLEELEDYIWRSLVPHLRLQIRPIGEHHIQLPAAANVIGLSDFPIETPYNIVGIDAVYDLTNDPGKLVDLAQAYDVANKVITLSTIVAADSLVLVRFLYEPEIAVNTDQEYIEVSKVPQIILEEIKQDDSTQEAVGPDYVINKATGTGKKSQPTQNDISIVASWITDKDKDHARLADALKHYFASNTVLRSVGQDEEFRLWLIDEYDQRTFPSQQGLRTGRLRFRIVKALFYDEDAEDITGVLDFKLALTSGF